MSIPPDTRQAVAADLAPTSASARAALAALARARWCRGTLPLDLTLTTAVVLLVMGPMLFTRLGFGLDFTNYLWLTWVVGKALAAAGHPTYFINVDQMGVFYQWLAFEGATLFTITGALGQLLGEHPEVAFAAVTALAIAGDYVGMLWLGRQLGLRGWPAHAPSVAVITSAYYITNLYGRGAWDEFIAVAAIAPVAASGLYLVRSDAWRPWAILTFVLSATILTGSHNLTLVWAPTMVAVGLLALWLAVGAPRELPYRRLAMVAGLGALAVLVNAWYLFTDAAYASFTVAHSVAPPQGGSLWSGTSFFNTPAMQLNPLRSVPQQSTTPALYVQAPVWLMAWGILAGAALLARRRVDRWLRRVWLCALALVVVILAMIMLKAPWSLLPFPWDEIQFPYRLDSYVFYAVAGLVLVTALAVQRAIVSRAMGVALRATLVGVCLISIGLCAWQLFVPNTLVANAYRNRGEAFASPYLQPRTWYDDGFFADEHAPVVAVPEGRLMLINPRQVHNDRFAAWLELPEGPQPIQSNIRAGSYLVHTSGVRQIGRDLYGYAVVQREPGSRGPVYVVIEEAHSAPAELGRLVSFIAIIAICMILAVTTVRRLRVRSRSRADRRTAAQASV